MPDKKSKYTRVKGEGYEQEKYTGKYSSISKSDNSKEKNWIGKQLLGEEIGPFGFPDEDGKSPVAEVFSQSLAVKIFGKGFAAKTKFSTTERMVVSRMPESESKDLSNIVEEALESNSSPALPSDSIAQAMAFKIIMEDDDANLGNYIIADEQDGKKSYCFPIDGDCSFSQQDTWSYEDFKNNVNSPKELARDLTSLKYATFLDESAEKENQALNIFTNNITSKQLVEAFDRITNKIIENDFSIMKEVIGGYDSEKGMLPDLKEGYQNDVYSLDEVNYASEKLWEYQNELASSVSRISGFVKQYKEEFISNNKAEPSMEEKQSSKKRSFQEMVKPAPEQTSYKTK